MSSTLATRVDIQALRGLAVGLVVAYHAKLLPFQGGYLGVDIFFVVSGFLIAGLIARDIRAGAFSFTIFYWRRAWRLLPALYATVAACLLVSPWLLTLAEVRDFATQVIGAIAFVANVALWLQTGYFEQAAEFKPLLHVWSLSIEEQYYLLVPAMLVFMPRKYWFVSALAVTVVSLALCLVMLQSKPSATFYLLPTRAWELGIGTLAALLSIPTIRYKALLPLLWWTSLFLIFYVSARPMSRLHPGFDAVVATLATACLLLFPIARLEQHRFIRVFAWLGDRSYSLYLVHWPIFAFVNVVNLDPDGPTWYIRLAASLVSLGAAVAMHRCVEQKFRKVGHACIDGRILWSLVAAAIFLAVSAMLLSSYAVRSTAVKEDRFRPNFGMHSSCEYLGDYVPVPACQSSPRPSVLVWGDSFAMHLVPALLAKSEYGLIQATKSACGPLLGLAPNSDRRTPIGSESGCEIFNDSIMSYLSRTDSIKTVVLSSALFQYLGGETGPVFRPRPRKDLGLDEINQRMELALNSVRDTVTRIHSMGKKVVFVAPPPSSGLDSGRCNERKLGGKPTIGVSASGCNIPLTDYAADQSVTLRFLQRLATEVPVGFVSFDSVLCGDRACVTELDGVPLYRDSGHLSVEGSRVLGLKMDLANRIVGAAR